MNDKLAHQAARLRDRTMKLLGLSGAFEALAPADQVLVDRVATLRLRVDDMRVAQLRGRQVDAAEFVRVSELLEQVLRVDRRAGVDGASPALDSARRKLAALLDVDLDATPEQERAREQERVTTLRAECDRLRLRVAELEALHGMSQPVAPPPRLPDERGPDGLTDADRAARANVLQMPKRTTGNERWRSYLSPSGEIMTSGVRSDVIVAVPCDLKDVK
jgi:hypothetical protein